MANNHIKTRKNGYFIISLIVPHIVEVGYNTNFGICAIFGSSVTTKLEVKQCRKYRFRYFR